MMVNGGRRNAGTQQHSPLEPSGPCMSPSAAREDRGAMATTWPSCWHSCTWCRSRWCWKWRRHRLCGLGWVAMVCQQQKWCLTEIVQQTRTCTTNKVQLLVAIFWPLLNGVAATTDVTPLRSFRGRAWKWPWWLHLFGKVLKNVWVGPDLRQYVLSGCGRIMISKMFSFFLFFGGRFYALTYISTREVQESGCFYWKVSMCILTFWLLPRRRVTQVNNITPISILGIYNCQHIKSTT